MSFPENPGSISDNQPPKSPKTSSSTPPSVGWTPPTVEHLQSLLPHYEIIAMIGRGGMGAVYQGRQKSLDRLVAIKILPSGLDDADAKFAERFKNEARLLARLSHPGVVAVHDFGETSEGQLYFVMEYVDGTDVARMIESNGRLPADHALTITAHVCDALGYAHANGVIHRDIKPANILVNKLGQVKVTDFGLARQSDASLTAGLTVTGVTMGTPDFIAPEALTLGADVDGRADLYAVGVMLYQMLTGDIPRGLFLMPGVKTKGEIDPRFDKIITRAMQTEREERYQLASEIRKDLDAIQTSPRVRADASKALPAVPTKVVREVLGESDGQQKVESRKQSRVTETGEAKWSGGMVLGIAAVIVVIGFAVFRSGIRQDSDQAEGGRASVGSLATSATNRPATSATSDGWTDGLAEWLAAPGNAAKGVLVQEGNAWRYKGPSAIDLGARLPGKLLANMAVRYTVRIPTVSSTAQITLRAQRTPGNIYQAVVYGSGKMGVHLVKDGQSTVLSKYEAPEGFDPTASHVIEFQAQGDRLTLIVDGQTRGSVIDSTFASGGFSVVNGLIEKIEYRDLGGTPAVAAASKPSTTSDGWIDGLAEWLAVPGNASSGVLQKEGNGWRNVGPTVVGMGEKLPGKSLSNLAVRLTFHHGGEKHSSLIKLRYNSKSPGSGYQAMVSPLGVMEIVLIENRELKTLAKASLPGGYDRNASHVMEFRAEGDKLTLSVDGQERLSVHDASFSSGTFSTELGVIEKLEYRDLGAASGEKWTDGLAEWLAVPGNATGGVLQKEGSGWRHMGPDAITIGAKLPGRSLANLAVRLTVRQGPGGIHLRAQMGAGNDYVAILSSDGAAQIARGVNNERTNLYARKAPAGYDRNARHVMEFRAEGDVLTLIVDGETLGTVKDTTYSAGMFNVTPRGSLIEALEYRDLGGVVAAESAMDSATQSKSSTKAETRPTEALAASATDGWVDGLAEFFAKPTEPDHLSRQRNGALVLKPGGFRISRRTDFHADLHIRVTARGGTADYWGALLSRGQAKAYAARIMKEGVVELHLLMPSGADSKLLRSFALPAGFNYAAKHTLEFRNTGDEFFVALDGQELGSARDGTLTGPTSVSLDSGPGALIEKFEYRVIPILSDTPAPTDGGGPWVNGLAEWLAVPGNASNGTLIKANDGAWRYVGSSSIHLVRDDRPLTNAAVRLTLRSLGEWVTVDFRANKKTQRSYSFSFAKAGAMGFNVMADGKTIHLARHDVAKGFDPKVRHVIELRAEGDLLTVIVDDQTIGSVRDASLPFGGGVNVVGKYSEIEKIDYRDLGGTAPTPPPPAPFGTWQDALAAWWAKPEAWRTGAMQQEAGGSRVLDDGPVWLAFNQRNIAVRATVLGGEAKAWRLGLRAKDGRCYAAILEATGKSRLVEITQAAPSPSGTAVEKPLAAFDLPPGFSLTNRHVVEFRTQGELLTVSMDGKEVARTRDAARNNGYMIFEGKGALIEKLEYSELAGDEP